jgi:acyl-CoA thioesterase II
VVEARREGRAANSHRIDVRQGGRPILDALVWSVADTEGLEHDETVPPAVPGPDDLPSLTEPLPDDAPPPFPFWDNFDAKPIQFEAEWPPEDPRSAQWQEWLRFLPTAVYDDPWVDAARSVILVDLPAGRRPTARTRGGSRRTPPPPST